MNKHVAVLINRDGSAQVFAPFDQYAHAGMVEFHVPLQPPALAGVGVPWESLPPPAYTKRTYRKEFDADFFHVHLWVFEEQ